MQYIIVKYYKLSIKIFHFCNKPTELKFYSYYYPNARVAGSYRVVLIPDAAKEYVKCTEGTKILFIIV